MVPEGLRRTSGAKHPPYGNGSEAPVLVSRGAVYGHSWLYPGRARGKGSAADAAAVCDTAATGPRDLAWREGGDAPSLPGGIAGRAQLPRYAVAMAGPQRSMTRRTRGSDWVAQSDPLACAAGRSVDGAAMAAPRRARPRTLGGVG